MNEEYFSPLPRRDFLKQTARLGGVLITAQLPLEISQAAEVRDLSKIRWGLLIDTTQCGKDCTACVDACRQEHGLTTHSAHETRPEVQPQWIRKVELRHKQTKKEHSLPVMCQHCENPPCADVCPTGASFKRADGIVLVDKHLCIGCRYCMMACPYKARSFVHETLTEQKSYSPRGKGTVEGCTLCVHRVDRGESPACVSACPKQAITFGNLNDANSEIAKKLQQIQSSALRNDLQLHPSVRYHGI